jgi:hypothetical protein
MRLVAKKSLKKNLKMTKGKKKAVPKRQNNSKSPKKNSSNTPRLMNDEEYDKYLDEKISDFEK